MDVIGHLLRRAGFGASGNDVKYETDFAPSTRASSTTGSAAIRWRSSAGTSGALRFHSSERLLRINHGLAGALGRLARQSLCRARALDNRFGLPDLRLAFFILGCLPSRRGGL